MKIKERIKQYKPYKGFYDLREYDLPDREFIRLWDVQDMLSHMSERSDYFKKFLPIQWEKAKEVSACYQHILFKYNLK
jgi:hypothetical protein